MAKKIDSITKILKSINPIKNPFSKISRQLNHSFKQTSLENLLKTIDKNVVYKEILLPKSNKITFKNDYNIDFTNSIEYLREFDNIYNLPIVQKNKNYIINGKINLLFEKEKIKQEKNRKYFLELREERKKVKNKELLEININSDLNYGKYNPKYEIIKPRLPNVLIRAPNIHIKDPWLIKCSFRNTLTDFKINLKEINKNNSLIKNRRKINKI